jgi:RNA 2',3'-cyclic 3'-phosphodiesterase
VVCKVAAGVGPGGLCQRPAGLRAGGFQGRSPLGKAIAPNNEPVPSPQPPVSPPDRARLFIALWPDELVRDGLLAWQRAVRWPRDARLAAPAGLHLTLHFIGAVPRSRLPELAAGLVVPAVPPFELLLDEFTVWPRGIAVLQPSAPAPAALATLHARLGDALGALDLPVEARPLRPHVTFARHGQGATLSADAPPPVRWACDGRYVLAESAGGYRVLQTFGMQASSS